jgi:nuclear transport factor 2 (NTF2) superfamily protein
MTDAAENWVTLYRRAWDSNEPDDVRAAFTDDAIYRTEPWVDDPWVGIESIIENWIDSKDEPGDFTFEHDVIGTSGDRIFVQGVTDYRPSEGKLYYNLWVVELAADGRARDFTEWYSTPSDDE